MQNLVPSKSSLNASTKRTSKSLNSNLDEEEAELSDTEEIKKKPRKAYKAPVQNPATPSGKLEAKAKVAIPAAIQDKLAPAGTAVTGYYGKENGKHFAGPESCAGARAQQVTRHITTLILNHSALFEKEDLHRRTAEFDRAVKNKAPKPAGLNLKDNNPVEVQMSMINGRLLIATNNRQASLNLYDTIKSKYNGSLKKYILDMRSHNLDGDLEQTPRYINKLNASLKYERHWQLNKSPQAVVEAKVDAADTELKDVAKIEENVSLNGEKNLSSPIELDRKMANAILAALGNDNSIGLFDPTNDASLKDVLSAWDNVNSPKVYIVTHDINQAEINLHAERVISNFRSNYLDIELDEECSMAPNGPKTPCLGCAVHHKLNHKDLPFNEKYVGALFQGSSSIETEEEIKAALEILETKPATGSVTRNGFENNSDYPESDSDEEGNVIMLIVQDYNLEKENTGKDKKTIWLDKDGETYTIDAKKKGADAEEEYYKQKAKVKVPTDEERKLRAKRIKDRKARKAEQVKRVSLQKKIIQDINKAKKARKEKNAEKTKEKKSAVTRSNRAKKSTKDE